MASLIRRYYTAINPKTGEKVKKQAKKWYGQYFDAKGNRRRVVLSVNKTAAQQMLNEIVRKVELQKAGIHDPFAGQTVKPIAEHVEDFRKNMAAKDNTDKHVKRTVQMVERIIQGCGFKMLTDIDAHSVEVFLAELREGSSISSIPPRDWFQRSELSEILGIGPRSIPPLILRHRLEHLTQGNGKARRYSRECLEQLLAITSRGIGPRASNCNLTAFNSFCNWLVRNRRIPDNPLAHVKPLNERKDRRHDRQTLSRYQLKDVLAAALRSERTFRGLTGVDRHHVYLTAIYSGLRASEIASLKPSSFSLDGSSPHVIMPAALTKNKNFAVQPIPLQAAKVLTAYLLGRPKEKPVWPGKWPDRGSDMLRIELDSCSIPYVIDGPNGPLYADFHSLRHSFVALIDASGVSPKMAMQLARHADPRLTMERYGKAGLEELSQAIEGMPSLLVE